MILTKLNTIVRTAIPQGRAMLRNLRIQPSRQKSAGRVAAAGVLTLVLLFVAVQPAAAGWVCDRFGICGKVINGTDTPMTIASFAGKQTCPRDRGGNQRCTKKTLSAGDDAGDGRGYFKDVDGLTFTSTGYYVRIHPSSERFVARGRYIKLYDTQTVRCTQAGPVAAPRCSFGG